MSTEPSQTNYGEALYHPHIHVRDVDWLKSAILYWDSVRRIVPANFPPDEADPDLDKDVRRLVLERPDLLPRTPPTKYVDAAIAKFIDCSRHFQGPPGTQLDQSGRSAIFDMVQGAYQRITGAKEMDRSGLKELLDNLLKDSRGSAEVDMWDSKMSGEFGALLREAGLLRDDDTTGYVWVQKAAADLYMICLATVMSENICSPLITYKPEYADVGKYLDLGVPQQPQDSRISMLLELDLPFPAREELHEISLSRILQVHDKTETERRNFRKAVEDLLAEGSRAQGDEYRYEGFLKDKKKDLAEEFRQYKEKMESLSIRSVGSLLRISAPTAVSTILTAVATLGFHVDPFTATALAGTGAALSGVTWWGEVRQQRREAIENFPYHYLLTLEKELPPSHS